MYGHFVLSVLLSLACVASTYAAGPRDDPAPVPPSMNLDGPALINDEALTNSGTAITVQPAVAGPRHFAYRGLETPHRSDDCNCCGESFGGFGSLWETYCADRNRCWGAGAACGPSPCYPRCGSGCRTAYPPLFTGCHWQALKTRFHRPNCCAAPSCDCDSAATVVSEPVDATPQEAAEPAAPTPADPTPAQPDESLQPAPTPPPAPPDAKQAQSTSSRRAWLQQRRAGPLPR